jgi:hypothetical protein
LAYSSTRRGSLCRSVVQSSLGIAKRGRVRVKLAAANLIQ